MTCDNKYFATYSAKKDSSYRLYTTKEVSSAYRLYDVKEIYDFFSIFLGEEIFERVEEGKEKKLLVVTNLVRIELSYRIMYFFLESIVKNRNNEDSIFYVNRDSITKICNFLLDFLKKFKYSQENLETKEFIDFCFAHENIFHKKSGGWNISSGPDEGLFYSLYFSISCNFLPAVSSHYIGQKEIFDDNYNLIEDIVICLVHILYYANSLYDDVKKKQLREMLLSEVKNFIISELKNSQLLFYTI
jgi:hypothetical protein